MKLRQLFENLHAEDSNEHDGSLKTIGICYGRWNPPHRGHKAVWQAASRNPIWFVGTNQNTEGPKDPLPYDVKLQCMAAVWPGVVGHVIPEQDLFVMATHIYEQYGENVHLKVYTDEEWLAAGLQKYNGDLTAKHGGYKFNQIDHVKTERLARATDLRKYVQEGNKEAFYKDAGIKPTSTVNIGDRKMPLFDVVAHYLLKYPVKKKVEVAEARTKKIAKSHKHSISNAMTFPSMNMSTGSAYLNYRMGVAMAGSPDNPGKADNYIGGDPFISTYTDEDMEIVDGALKALGITDKQNWTGRGTEELPSTNTNSPVAKPKRNKYGI